MSRCSPLPDGNLPAHRGNRKAGLTSLSLALRWGPVAALFLLGCANPGPLRPPSLNLPRPAGDLRAERVGDTVRLHWTTAEDTTDNLPVRGTIAAEICRTESTTPAPCAWSTTVTVVPGASEAEDALPGELRSDPPRLLVYRVRLNNSAGRSAGASPPAFAASGAAPPPVTHLQAVAVARGARLTWQTAEGDAAVFLFRTEQETAAKRKHDGGPPLIKAPGRGRRRSTNTSASAASGPEGSAEIRLQAAAAGPDAGGSLDTSAPFGVPLSYRAERVRQVAIAGHPFTLRSAASPGVSIVLRDIFPPAAPAGLLAVDGTRPGETQPAIDLSWEPGAEPDLAGYLVERAEGEGNRDGNWQLLTPAAVPASSYHDAAVRAGNTYRYRVFAVDRSGNRSAPGPAASFSVPPPSPAVP